MEGVHRRLHRVADVVEAAHRRRVRVAIARGVAVDHPDEPPVGPDDQVRVAVEPEERRRLLHARADVAVDHHAALGREIVRQQDVERAEARREGRLADQRVDRDAAPSLVARVDVLVAGGIVELLRARAHEHVLVADLAVVDLGPRDLGQAARHRGRDVLDEELGQSLRADPVDRSRHQAVAVGVGQVLVDPVPARQVAVGQLARREHDLAVLAVHRVAVHVDVQELVVGPDLLELAVGGEQRPVVPEPDVLDREVVALERGGRQVVLGREVLLRHPVERVRLPRHPDVVLDVRPLEDQLVGLDPVALEQRGRDPEARDPEHHQHHEPRHQEAPARPEHLEHAGRRAEEREHDQPLRAPAARRARRCRRRRRRRRAASRADRSGRARSRRRGAGAAARPGPAGASGPPRRDAAPAR